MLTKDCEIIYQTICELQFKLVVGACNYLSLHRQDVCKLQCGGFTRRKLQGEVELIRPH